MFPLNLTPTGMVLLPLIILLSLCLVILAIIFMGKIASKIEKLKVGKGIIYLLLLLAGVGLMASPIFLPVSASNQPLRALGFLLGICCIMMVMISAKKGSSDEK